MNQKEAWNLLKAKIAHWQAYDGSLFGFEQQFPEIYLKLKKEGHFNPHNQKSTLPNDKFLTISLSKHDPILIVFKNYEWEYDYA